MMIYKHGCEFNALKTVKYACIYAFITNNSYILKHALKHFKNKRIMH